MLPRPSSSLPPQSSSRLPRRPFSPRRLVLCLVLYGGALYLFQRFIARPASRAASQPAPTPSLHSPRPARVQTVSVGASSAATSRNRWLRWQTETTREMVLGISWRDEAQWQDMNIGWRSSLHITPREGMRAVMRCFPDVPPFAPLAADSLRGATCLGDIGFTQRDGTLRWVSVYRKGKRALLHRDRTHTGARIALEEAARFQTLIRTVFAKTQKHEAGYSEHYERDV